MRAFYVGMRSTPLNGLHKLPMQQMRRYRFFFFPKISFQLSL